MSLWRAVSRRRCCRWCAIPAPSGSAPADRPAKATRDSFARIEPLGTGALATVDMPAKHYRRLLRGLRQFGAVAGAAFAARSHSRHRRRLRLLSRDQCIHGARAGALQHARCGVLDPGLSLPEPRRGDAPARYRAAARLLPAHAVGGSSHHGGGAASCRTHRRHAGLRSDRLPDRRGPAEFRGLSAGRARPQYRRRHGGVGLGTDPARHLPDRHRRRRFLRARQQGGRPARSDAAARQPQRRQAGARRRPAGLFQRPRQSRARLRPHAGDRAEPRSAK